ncbi:UDP-N-acetyl-D-glucosamine dehydrogenase [Singulisphaera sp. GP187]|uniref:nucleotide sugar dehydrogenase n=1 Tax=Singulisphaera sp. GP187 TaxID=1882752 RepID=UPI00092B6632|nr:nucleotide sugar dehydrogenase [Singulisphaera sp. GP187]SIO55405.1 UDP-N-acetyl-D-glucosamine dehydrogenase [Singulisphaera sp. GP187]
MISKDTDPGAFQSLLGALKDCSARIGVIGLGYVGLPLVELFAGCGFRVLGFDIDSSKVERLQAGESYIGHISSERVSALRDGGHFTATSDFSRLTEVDAILICVPTPLGKHREPDLSAVIATGQSIGRYLRRGQLVILESTTYPGTTRDVLKPELEAGGLVAGRDFYLAYSPEREDPGNPKFSAGTIPKVVGGYDEMSGQLAQALYGAAVPEVVPVTSCEVAEACKILENTYRAVNIALVNELKLVFERMGIDVWEVIDAAKTKPFGFQAFYPGPGLGGHCIPIDPFYLTWVAHTYGLHTRFIELAGEINTAMPHHVIDRVTAALNDAGKAVKGSRILVLGAAYKPNVDDCRESPAVELMELLQDRGATVSYSDPHVPALPLMRGRTVRLESTPLSAETLSAQDCVLIATDHKAFDWELILTHSSLVIDTRGATRKALAERTGPSHVIKA